MELHPWLKRALPFVVMITEECLAVGLSTISKSAISKGMNRYVFLVYSNALATLILLPTFFINRGDRPPLTLTLLCKFFLLSLVGITMMQNFIYAGLDYGTTTLASAMVNMIPACTFVLSVIFRMEKLDLRSSRSLIKILGTIVSICGALIIALYQGPVIISSSTKLLSILLKHSRLEKLEAFDVIVASSNWLLGSLFLAAGSFSFSVWNVAQAATLKGYPSGVTIVFFYCLFGAIQTAIVSLILVKDLCSWRFNLGIEYVVVLYSAIIGNVVIYNADTWCIKVKGPVFVAMFKPIGIAIAAITGVIFLGNNLYLGSILGAIVIVIGFYAVIWSKAEQDVSHINESKESASSSEGTSLLQ